MFGFRISTKTPHHRKIVLMFFQPLTTTEICIDGYSHMSPSENDHIATVLLLLWEFSTIIDNMELKPPDCYARGQQISRQQRAEFFITYIVSSPLQHWHEAEATCSKTADSRNNTMSIILFLIVQRRPTLLLRTTTEHDNQTYKGARKTSTARYLTEHWILTGRMN